MKLPRSLGIGLLVTLALVGASCGSKKKAVATSVVAPADSAAPLPSVGPSENAPRDSAAAAPVRVKTKQSGQLAVCSDIPYAPFEYFENGSDGPVVGIDADIVKAAATTLGLKAEFRPTAFKGIFIALANGDCDVIASSVTINDVRKQRMDFTDAYFTVHQSILVRSADAALNDLSAFENKIVGVPAGATFAKAEAEADAYTIKEFPGSDKLVAALTTKQVDGAVQDFPVNAYAATKSGGALVISKVFENAGDSYGLVVAKGNPDLTKALNGALAKMKADGRFKAILAKYLGSASDAGG